MPAGSEKPLIRLKVDGTTYALSADDITIGRLRQFKGWFGKDYGAYLPFIQMLVQGDADAVACAIWLARENAGVKPNKAPQFIDIPVSDIYKQDEEEEEDEADAEEVPPTEPESEKTPDSEPTPPPSEPATSST